MWPMTSSSHESSIVVFCTTQLVFSTTVVFPNMSWAGVIVLNIQLTSVLCRRETRNSWMLQQKRVVDGNWEYCITPDIRRLPVISWGSIKVGNVVWFIATGMLTSRRGHAWIRIDGIEHCGMRKHHAQAILQAVLAVKQCKIAFNIPQPARTVRLELGSTREFDPTDKVVLRSKINDYASNLISSTEIVADVLEVMHNIRDTNSVFFCADAIIV